MTYWPSGKWGCKSSIAPSVDSRPRVCGCTWRILNKANHKQMCKEHYLHICIILPIKETWHSSRRGEGKENYEELQPKAPEIRFPGDSHLEQIEQNKTGGEREIFEEYWSHFGCSMRFAWEAAPLDGYLCTVWWKAGKLWRWPPFSKRLAMLVNDMVCTLTLVVAPTGVLVMMMVYYISGSGSPLMQLMLQVSL